MGSEFKREIRYVVTKIKTGKQVDCVVVEADWPEYEPTWDSIRRRVQGEPTREEMFLAALSRLRAENERLREELREFRSALMRLASCDSQVFVGSDGIYSCIWCGLSGTRSDLHTPAKHNPDCEWRRAKELLEPMKG